MLLSGCVGPVGGWGAIIALALIPHGLALPRLTSRVLPWGDGIPIPEPAETAPPVDWAAISPPLFCASNLTVQQGGRTGHAHAANAASDDSPYLPALVDWRNRNGMNYITTPQNQGGCQSCWAFGVAGLIDAMVRIEHGIWSKRSEGDVHDAVGAACESVGTAQDTLAFFAGVGSAYPNGTGPPPGVADWACDPYEATAHAYAPCLDRSGRATYIPMYQAIGTVDEQKRWIDQYGPLVATFKLYSDFQPWNMSEMPVYKVGAEATTSENHIALVVGYDDGKGAWVMKNSWGPTWGDHGFVYFGYGEANIDGWIKYGVTNVDPDPWARKRHQSGSMMQSGNGQTHRNFELLLAFNSSSKGTFSHVSRDGTTGQWSLASHAGEASAVIGQPVLIGTSTNRDFAAVILDGNKTIQQWSYSQKNRSWAKLASIAGQGIDGCPGLAQDDDSALVLVVRHTDGTLNEWRQQPSSSTWTRTAQVASSIKQSGPSLVVSNIGQDIYSKSSRGNIYVAAVRSDGKLQVFSRPGNGTAWAAGDAFGSGVGDTPPVMIQDFFNTTDEKSPGGFQLVVAVDGAVQHWQRGNTDSTGQWKMVETVGAGVRHTWSLIQGSFGQKMHMLTEGVDGKFSYWEWDGAWKLVETLSSLDDAGWTITGDVTGG